MLKRMHRKKSKIIIVVIVLFLSIFNIFFLPTGRCEVLVNGDTLYVGGDGPGNYSEIQEAMNAAHDGDTIYVYNGTYSPIYRDSNDKMYPSITLDKSINLIGENRDTTI